MAKLSIVTFNILNESSGFYGIVTDEDKKNAAQIGFRSNRAEDWTGRYLKGKKPCLFEKQVDGRLALSVPEPTDKPIGLSNCWLKGSFDESRHFHPYRYDSYDFDTGQCDQELPDVDHMRLFEGRFCFNTFPLNPVSRYSRARKKLLSMFLMSIVRLGANVICLQEVSDAMCDVFTKIFDDAYEVIYYRESGLVTLISKKLVRAGHVTVYNGNYRSLFTTFDVLGGRKVTIMNMHYFGSGETSVLENFVLESKAYCAQHYETDLFVLAGDLNNGHVGRGAAFEEIFDHVHQGLHGIDYICVATITPSRTATSVSPNGAQRKTYADVLSPTDSATVKSFISTGSRAIKNPRNVLKIPKEIKGTDLTFTAYEAHSLVNISDHPPLNLTLRVLPQNGAATRQPTAHTTQQRSSTVFRLFRSFDLAAHK